MRLYCSIDYEQLAIISSLERIYIRKNLIFSFSDKLMTRSTRVVRRIEHVAARAFERKSTAFREV